MAQDIKQTLELVKQALGQPVSAETIAKSGWAQPSTATTGLASYNLEAPAKTLYPVLTPLRNAIPRVTVNSPGIQANWRAITGINTANVRLGLSEGHRGGTLTHTTQEYTAAFRFQGLDDQASFESVYAGQGFDDIQARLMEGLLRAVMIGEENLILGGNTSVRYGSSGVCPTPTVALNADTTSSVTNGTLLVKCVAMGPAAYWALAGYNNGAVGSSLGLTLDPNDVAYFTKTNADASSDLYNGGVGQISSASAGVTIDASHKSAGAYVTAVPGAAAYAWYTNSNGAGYYLHSITTTNNVKIDADATTSIAPGSNLSSDHSRCTQEYDGLLAIAATSGSGAYVQALATGTPGTGTYLTSNGAGGIAEFDTMFADRWNLYRLSVDEMWMSAQQLLDVNDLVIKNGGAPLIRYQLDGSSPATMIDAGTVVGSILNPITNTKVQIKVHPNMAPGTILARCTQLPYKLSGVTDVCRVLCRRDYHSITWPIVSRSYAYGVYIDSVLQHYFPPALGIIYNIAAGHA